MHRRSLIAQLAALGLTGLPARARTDSSAWSAWRDRFLAGDGRVIDTGQGGMSHSEGQAYGLLLAQSHGDRDSFEQIESWTRSHLATRQDALMAWSWRDGAVTDWRNATDGDLLRAWALLRAHLFSGWAGHERVALEITRAIAAICLAPDPRAPEELLLKPADLQMGDPDQPGAVLVNPSYYHSRALRELGAAFDDPRLIRTADHGETLLRAPQALRDWVLVRKDGLHPPKGLADRFSYDAIRIPLYLCWSDRSRHPAVAAARSRLDAATLPGHLAISTDPDGHPLAQSNLPGFHAVRALTLGQPVTASGADIRAQGYYPATLQLLATVAARESAD